MAGGPGERQRHQKEQATDFPVRPRAGFGIERLDHDLRFRPFLRQDLRVLVFLSSSNYSIRLGAGLQTPISLLPILPQDGARCDDEPLSQSAFRPVPTDSWRACFRILAILRRHMAR